MHKKKILYIAGAIYSALTFLLYQPVYASVDRYETNIYIGNVVWIFLVLFKYIGIILLVWGIAQFIMAIKRTDAESKSDAILTIVCAIILMVLGTIIRSMDLGIILDGLELQWF